MKKKLALLMACMMAIGSLAACGSSGKQVSETNEPTAESTKAPSEGRTEIAFWHYMAGTEGDFLSSAVAEFNDMQDEILVTEQFLPREELMKQYTIGVVSGELPDVGMVDNPDHNAYAMMGIFEDIKSLYDSWEGAKFLDGPLNSCIYEDGLYGLPWTSNCLGLFYNEEMLKTAGVEVPTTWSELEVAAEKLTTDSIHGLAISAIGNEEGTFQYIPWLLSSGGSVTEMDSDKSKESMSYLYGLIEKGYVSKEVINWTQADVQKQFASGQVAMMINGPWQLANMAADAPDLVYGVGKVPKADNGEYASVLGGENVGICAGANVEAAWQFVSWLTDKEKSEELCIAAGYFSPRTDVDPQEIFADDPLRATFAEVMPSAQPRGPSPDWPEISTAIYTAQQEVFAGQKDVDTALNEAQEKINAINTN